MFSMVKKTKKTKKTKHSSMEFTKVGFFTKKKKNDSVIKHIWQIPTTIASLHHVH